MTAEIWYRYEQREYAAAPFDECGRWPGTTRVVLLEFFVVRHTAKGAWVARKDAFGNLSYDGERFVLTTAHKRYAWPTKAEAMTSFVARKRRQIAIYEARIIRAKLALDIASRVEVTP